MSEYNSDAMDKVRKQGIKKARTKNPAARMPPNRTTRISCGAIDERRGAGLKTREQNEESGGIPPGTEQKEGSISECSCSGF